MKWGKAMKLCPISVILSFLIDVEGEGVRGKGLRGRGLKGLRG